MKTGWISTSGYWYYFNLNTGAMHKGWLKSFHLLNLNNTNQSLILTIPYALLLYQAKNGWITEDGKTYYYDLGNKVIGLASIDGQTYYFDNSGVMKTEL